MIKDSKTDKDPKENQEDGPGFSYAEVFCTMLAKQNQLKEKLNALRNEEEEKNEVIMKERLEERKVLQQALMKFDLETKKMQRERLAGDDSQQKIEVLNAEIEDCRIKMGAAYYAMESCDPFFYKGSEAGITITKTTEMRSGGISLGSITQALVNSNTFSTVKEAEEVIKKHNMCPVAVLKIKDSNSGQVLDLQKDLPKPPKKAKKN